MRSSGTTRSRSSDGGIPLTVWLVGEDHPRACTGRRLLRQGLAAPLAGNRPTRGGVLLDPHHPVPLARSDRPRALRHGLIVVDCSWNRLSQRGRYPSGPLDGVPAADRRRLPWLLAGNAQHYGRVGELNTAEALAASLHLLGEPERAADLLERTSAGRSFLELNAARLSAYAEGRDAADVGRIERALFGGDDG